MLFVGASSGGTSATRHFPTQKPLAASARTNSHVSGMLLRSGLDIEVDPGSSAVLSDLLAIEFHFKFRHAGPLHAAHRLGGFSDRVFSSLCEAFRRNADHVDNFLRHEAFLSMQFQRLNSLLRNQLNAATLGAAFELQPLAASPSELAQHKPEDAP